MRSRIAVVVALLAVTGCTAPAPAGDATTKPPLAKLAVGQCTTQLDQSMQIVDCAKPHQWEVAGVVPLDATTYPGKESLQITASEECPAVFRDLVGVNAESSPYSLTYIGPTQEQWAAAGTHQLACLAGSPEVSITGSLEGRNLVFPQVGECIQQPSPSGIGVHLAPCDDKHYYEVYATKNWTSKKTPTQKQLDKLYSEVCVKGFTSFVGVSPGKSDYEILRFQAPISSWQQVPDHRLVCAAGSPSGGITGTLKGAKK